MSKKRDKLIMIIVEGQSDAASLEMIMEEIIPKNMRLKCVVANGDITTNPTVNEKNIKKKLTEIITRPPNDHFNRTDYVQVIHLIDMDGAYITEDKIFEDDSVEGFIYSENGITAKKREWVKKRNEKKQRLLNILIETHKVNISIPYKVMFMSCNLEHVLHDKISVPDEEKVDLGVRFADRFINREEEFISFICDSSFAVKNPEMDDLFEVYKESWNFIRKDNNSIKRYTNFNIFLKKLMEYKEN